MTICDSIYSISHRDVEVVTVADGVHDLGHDIGGLDLFDAPLSSAEVF